MMKSIFLSDSRMLDTISLTTGADSNSDSNDEFVMVDCTPDSYTNIVEEEDDDDEYDYCEDAMSEGMQDRGCSFSFSVTEDMILEEASEEPSIHHILDEAHQSASQLVAENTEPNNPAPGVLESSASDVSVQTAPPVVEEMTATPSIAEPPSLQPPQQQPPMAGGRMSNKKRRKKMKLLKKAAAAAKAAAALSSDIPQSANITSSSNNKPSSKKTLKAAHTTRYQNKRVANHIAVACATETLTSYKAHLKSSKKVH